MTISRTYLRMFFVGRPGEVVEEPQLLAGGGAQVGKVPQGNLVHVHVSLKRKRSKV